jgi:hypothetical protein
MEWNGMGWCVEFPIHTGGYIIYDLTDRMSLFSAMTSAMTLENLPTSPRVPYLGELILSHDLSYDSREPIHLVTFLSTHPKCSELASIMIMHV